jgi:hypothetical protein
MVYVNVAKLRRMLKWLILSVCDEGGVQNEVLVRT